MRSTPRSPYGAYGVALLMSLGVLAGCGTSDEVATGDVVEATSTSSASGTEISIIVPRGTLELVVSAPAATVGDLEAPDGGSLVRIESTFVDGEVRGDVWRFAGRADAVKAVDLRVDVGSRTYPVGTVRGVRGGSTVVPRDLVLALSESPREAADLSLSVAYDGVLQRVDLDGNREPGPADALYDDEREAVRTD